MPQTQRETVELDAAFLKRWQDFCAGQGYIPRRAAYACRYAFMHLLTAKQREDVMAQVSLADGGEKKAKPRRSTVSSR